MNKYDKKGSPQMQKKDFRLRIDYSKLQAALVYIVCALFIAVSLFNIFFNSAMIMETKSRIESTWELIDNLNGKLENIDTLNEEYATDKLSSEYDRTLLISSLSELWSYRIEINGEVLTKENFDDLTDVREGEDVEISLVESMRSTSIPYNLAKKGNSRRGEPIDELKHQFWILSKIDATYDLTENVNDEEKDGLKYTSVGNVLTYRFLKGEGDVEISIFLTIAVNLDLPGEYDINYVLTLR